MNGFKKFLIFSGLSLLLLFAFFGGNTVLEKSQKENSGTYFSSGHLHTLAFIQPEMAHAFVISAKIGDYSPTKCFSHFLQAVPEFKIRRALAIFPNQDINRCEKVSLLLFPFHIFW
jgi:hypothetical protein